MITLTPFSIKLFQPPMTIRLIAESDSTTVVTEAGSTDTFTVVLDAEPDSDVVIDLSTPDATEATVSLTSLTFTPTNWNTPQTVTVTGVNDDIIDGDISSTITLAINAGWFR